MSFVGRFSKNIARPSLAHLYGHMKPLGLSNMIVDSSAKASGEKDTTESTLLATNYPLVLPGDRMQSTRLSEAVCAGGVPVLFRARLGIQGKDSHIIKQHCRALDWYKCMTPTLSVPPSARLPAGHLASTVPPMSTADNCSAYPTKNKIMPDCLWRPPHEDSQPFSSYGLLLENATSLQDDLLAVPPARFAKLRATARCVCNTHFRSTAESLSRMLEHFMNPTSPRCT